MKLGSGFVVACLLLPSCKQTPPPADSARTLEARPAQTTGAPADKSLAWQAFKTCLAEKRVQDPGGAFACLPASCTFEYVQSDSAQNACELVVTGGESCKLDQALTLPRVIVSCDGDHFVPSWGFCASHQHLEVGTVQAPDQLLMYDLHFPNPSLAPLAMDDPNNTCGTCHFSEDPYLHISTATDPNQVLARGRDNPFIRDLCGRLEGFRQQGCGISGSYLGDPVEVDADILLNLCAGILGAEKVDPFEAPIGPIPSGG